VFFSAEFWKKVLLKIQFISNSEERSALLLNDIFLNFTIKKIQKNAPTSNFQPIKPRASDESLPTKFSSSLASDEVLL